MFVPYFVYFFFILINNFQYVMSLSPNNGRDSVYSPWKHTQSDFSSESLMYNAAMLVLLCRVVFVHV